MLALFPKSSWWLTSIRFGFLALFTITPLLWYPANYELFEYNKMMFVYAVTIAITGLWFIGCLQERHIVLPKPMFTIILLIYLLANFITTFTSMDAHTSWYGYYSRFNGGLFSTISYTLLYLIFTATCWEKSVVKHLLLGLCASTTVVSIYAIAERMGIDKHYWVQDVQSRVFSTLGQPNWLAALLAMVIPVNIAFFLLEKNERIKSIHFVSFVLNYLAFTFTYSRGGTLGLIAALLYFMVGLLVIKRHVKTAVLLMIAVVMSSGILFGNAFLRESQFRGLVNSVAPVVAQPEGGTALERPGTESSVIRKIVWQGAWNIFKAHPITGTGVETFAYAYYQYRPIEHNNTTEWDFIYNKAHNEYLNELATKGLVGFVPYGVVIGFVLWTGTRALFYKGKKVPEENQIMLLALTAGYISYLIQNIFGFSVVMIAVLFFIYPGIILFYNQEVASTNYSVWKQPLRFARSTLNYRIGFVLVCLVTAYCLMRIAKDWQADTLYAAGYNRSLQGHASVGYQQIAEAIGLNSTEPLYYSQLGYIASELIEVAQDQNESALATQLKDDALAYTKEAERLAPDNVIYLRNSAKVYANVASVDPTYRTKALEYAYKIVDRSPTDPHDRIRLATALALANQPDKAEQTYQEAIKLKPDYRDARYAYAVFLRSLAPTDQVLGTQDQAEPAIQRDFVNEARQQLEYILDHIASSDAEVQDLLASISAKPTQEE